MVKEVALKFEITSNSFKDGNLLLYNKDRGYFYAVTPEMFLTRQNEEIKRMKEHCSEKEKNMEKEIDELKKEIKELHNHYDNFLSNYKETNAKLLDMVESFIKNYGGNN